MRRLRRRGALSAYLLLGMSVLLVLALGASGAAVHSMKRSTRDARAIKAFQVAQAGLDYALAKEYEDLYDNNGRFLARSYEVTDKVAPFADNVEARVRVQPTSDPRKAWVTCTASLEGMTKSVRVYVEGRPVGVWNNAVFAGSGASGQAINGNVDIRGSMHILGEGEPYTDVNGNGRWDDKESFTDVNGNGVWDPGEPFVDANGDGVWNPAEPFNDLNRNGSYDPPLTQTDLSSSFGGTAHVGNNYSGMPAALEAMVPAAPRVNGIETLGTEVRVKHGRISINGTATIGSSTDPDGGTSKGKIDGSYVNDGYTGNQGAANVFSDNGATNGYDLGFLGIPFPVIAGIGAQPYKDTTGTVWPTQEHFLEARSLPVPISQITPDTPAFTYGPDAFGNSISFVPQVKSGNTVISPATLTVTGVIRFSGDLTIGDSKTDIRYQGNGTLYGRQSVNVRSNLLPRNGFIFPTTARLGIIAMRDLNLATGSGDAQLSMAGAFYAQGKIVSRKQNQIAGTFVASYYDMGTNVPNIYQVPSLPDNMPPAMPGDKLYLAVKNKTWRDRLPGP